MHRGLIAGSTQDAEAWTDERCFIRELLNDSRAPESSLAVSRVEPGVSTQWHRLSVAEYYIVREGEGRMELGNDAPFRIGPGDSVAIPAGTPQRVTCCSDAPLIFYCLCTPRFTPDCYEALGD